MFVPLPNKYLAEEVRFLIQNITGDRVRIIGLGQQGNRWIVERWSGSEWVEA